MNLAVMFAAKGVPCDRGCGDDHEAAAGALGAGERDVHGSDHAYSYSVGAISVGTPISNSNRRTRRQTLGLAV
jgi:hypothetical protein